MKELIIRRADEVVIVRFQDSLLHDADDIDFFEKLTGLVAGLTERKLLLNFEGVTLTAGPLAKLVGFNCVIRRRKMQLKLCCLNMEMKAVFAITRLDQCFSFFDTEEEALQAF